MAAGLLAVYAILTVSIPGHLFLCGAPTQAYLLTVVYHLQGLFCRPDQLSHNSYVDDNSSLLVSSLPSLFYTMSSHRDIYIYEC
jgi:hypothetical protein